MILTLKSYLNALPNINPKMVKRLNLHQRTGWHYYNVGRFNASFHTDWQKIVNYFDDLLIISLIFKQKL